MSENGSLKRCPCGRIHERKKRPRRAAKPIDHDRFRDFVYEARMSGKAELDADKEHIFLVRYSGNCSIPIQMPMRQQYGHLMAKVAVRCRECKNCREAKRRYWGRLGAIETLQGASEGRRAWFGTLTYTKSEQQELLRLAIDAHMQKQSNESVPAWFEDVRCEERFDLVRHEVVEQLKRYWKRLRKAGHRFTYLVAVERHKSGLPHVHFLLHEKEGVIMKKDLAAKWPHGFTKCKLAGGKELRMDEAEKCAWYVVKYITKHHQSRMIASKGYGKKPPI